MLLYLRLRKMFQKGSAAIIILFAIVASTIFAVGGFWIGRSTGPKPEIKKVITSDTTQQTKSTPSPISSPKGFPSPTPDSELSFPSPCISPPANPLCLEIGSRLKIHNDLNELIRDSELIVVGYATDSCLDKDSTIKPTSDLSQTLYIGHLVIERSLKNPSRLVNPFILTAATKEWSKNSQTFSSHCVILTPNKRSLLFLKKRSNDKYYSNADSELEIQDSILLKKSRNPNFFEQEIIQLGLDGLAERISKLTQ